MWYEYIIECIGWGKWNLGKKIFYTGETSRNPEIRFNEHVNQINSYFMKHNKWRPRRLVYIECMPDCYSKDVAMLREQQLKRSHDERGFADEVS